MRQAGKVALGQLSVRGSEKLVAIKSCGKGLLLETLRYADEVRKGQALFAEIDDAKPKKKLLDLPKTLIEQKSAPFDARASTRRPSRRATRQLSRAREAANPKPATLST